MKIPLHYDPRSYQAEALAALERGVKMSLWCWARRGGKDLTAFSYATKKMTEAPFSAVLVYPTKQQGYEAFWTNIENDGFQTLDHIPASLIASQTNSPSNMKIILKNGSTFTLLGASEPEALRGANGKLYIFSEFVDISGAALDVIRPIVANNGGQIIIQSTPKIDGISGGTFKVLYDRAKETPKQFASLVTAKAFLPAEILEELRQECIAKNGNDFVWRQEYMCDWGQTSSVSYYGAVLQLLTDQGAIRDEPYNPAHPAYTAWDLGMSDSTAITFFQIINNRPRIIDYHETHDIGSEPIVKFVQAKPYNLAWHFFPHDGSVRDSDAIQRIEKIRDHGLINSSLLRRGPVEDGITRTVEGLANTYFNKNTTIELRRKLQLYKRKFNPLTGDYLGPEHKTESHAADSVRYMFDAIDQEFDTQTGAFLYAPESAQNSYEVDPVITPAQFRF